VQELTLGIDVACRAAHQASLAGEAGRFAWSGRRFRTITADLERALVGDTSQAAVTVVMEPTRNAWVPLAAWFRRSGCAGESWPRRAWTRARRPSMHDRALRSFCCRQTGCDLRPAWRKLPGVVGRRHGEPCECEWRGCGRDRLSVTSSGIELDSAGI
jgi:hypothetical protein